MPIEFGHEQIKKICAGINELAKKVGKAKRKVEPPMIDQDYMDDLRTKMGERLADAANTEKYPRRKLRPHQEAERRTEGHHR